MSFVKVPSSFSVLCRWFLLPSSHRPSQSPLVPWLGVCAALLKGRNGPLFCNSSLAGPRDYVCASGGWRARASLPWNEHRPSQKVVERTKSYRLKGRGSLLILIRCHNTAASSRPAPVRSKSSLHRPSVAAGERPSSKVEFTRIFFLTNAIMLNCRGDLLKNYKGYAVEASNLRL